MKNDKPRRKNYGKVRGNIIEALSNNEKMRYCKLKDYIDASDPSVQFHLKQLIEEEIIAKKREGRDVFYFLVDSEYVSSLSYKVWNEMICQFENAKNEKEFNQIIGSVITDLFKSKKKLGKDFDIIMDLYLDKLGAFLKLTNKI